MMEASFMVASHFCPFARNDLPTARNSSSGASTAGDWQVVLIEDKRISLCAAASGKAFSEFLQLRQTCRHRCKLRLCILLLPRIGRQFACMDALLLNPELVLGDDAVELINKQSISTGHVSALPQEVGAVTLGGGHRSNAASHREKPPGQHPDSGAGRWFNLHRLGPEPITLSVPLRTNQAI